MVRIKDIAEKCGVSTASVSYVLHGKTEKVSPAVREKIEKEIAESGYISNQSALSLVSRSSGLIGVAVMNGQEKKNILSDPYFGIFFSYLEKEFRKNDKYILIILNQSADQILKDAMRWNLDGLILCNHKKDVMLQVSSQYVKPIVTIDASFAYEYNKLVQIFIDDFNGGYITGKYFISAGHTKVAMLDDTDCEEDRHRWRGFKKAFEDAGVPIDESSHFIIDIEKEEMLDGMNRLYSQMMEKTAIFCISDFYALQLINFLQSKGVKVPEDISISGYDNINYSTICTPKITTVSQNVEKKAKLAVESMLKMIAGKEVGHSIKMPVELVIRESTRGL
ncbi:LacI family transcriptional regulator [Pseudobutyrivibrio sp. YE44]|uniref:LacI family DNA-binding transcriptional regulator n=1 Tax=Pseudobutyrivibrio sp. YE44 TaxID=1520802 RepID=UPI00088F2A34|nr:LacI family DNA-binding transcriptional regulator [Pseudobutyrivibrio sp. YE44]SDB25320.1 LacI family transcriptional regulator [Pseudobutyrivibrio sp. YE44]